MRTGIAVLCSSLATGLSACCCAGGGSRSDTTATTATATATTAATATASRPFKGVVGSIPGTVEAENFDEGPMGVAYHDLDPQNQGAPYRETSADIEQRPDASGGHGVGWTKAGEWLTYTVDIAAAGSYRLEIPVASNGDGGTFHLEVGGQDVTGPIKVPTTGSWQTLKVIGKDEVKLPHGRHVLRVVMDTEGETQSVADIDLFRFTAR